MTCWRFLRRMLMTSNAVHPASAMATSSMGLAPVFAGWVVDQEMVSGAAGGDELAMIALVAE